MQFREIKKKCLLINEFTNVILFLWLERYGIQENKNNLVYCFVVLFYWTQHKTCPELKFKMIYY